MSDVIKFMLVQKDRERYGRKAKAGDRVRWESGRAWEEEFSYSLARRMGYAKPEGEKPLVKDGIVMTRDFYDRKNRIVIETKWTLMSAAHDIRSSRLWGYRVQVMGYALGHDTNRADLIVYYAMGDYRWPKDGGLPDPIRRRYQLKFGRSELEKNWDMVKVNRDAMLKARGKN